MESKTSKEMYFKVKQLLETDIIHTANSLLESGEWVLLDVRKGRFTEWAYVLGRIS